MTIFQYDKTFEGLLTAVFDAYFRRSFPDMLVAEEEPLPLFYDEVIPIYTDAAKCDRVWKGLQKKVSATALSVITVTWLSELPGIDILLFRYIRKAIDAPKTIELNFGDPIVLEVAKIWKKVSNERLRVMQFFRFQKAADGTFFSALEPLYNVLPLVIPHLKDRFADQHWLIYDLKREYGYYYDLKEVTEVRFEEKQAHLLSGLLSEDLMDENEKLFQQLWKEYFKSIAIKERLNPKLHRQHMPARFWKYMTEKQ
ncbi:TIGR03915 family putative DNA repair protein [Parabacteroides sp. AM08-6]|uniref:TIGR03915 family putative DNA repair protein n=1 Tax=Parabacteroides sp. AM08-6 TaxID=2292053 RepID=UPI000EFF9B38|nr:TIGR03915 family putative DNA repair protein [Parabacteroides sp. AM08-6]RHJ80310.1 DNA metabolism protein [Parabacteroides sp. AM08-6]